MSNEARRALERIAHVLYTAQVRWEGDTVLDYISALVTAGLAKSVPSETVPIPMVLHCPNCRAQHIDAPSGEWTNPPHRSHECQSCGCTWRPADVPTNGVKAIQTKGKKDWAL